MEDGTTTDPNTSFVSSGFTAQPGTYAIDITTAAAQATVLGSGFPGTYTDDASADTLTVTDTETGGQATVSPANGMTIADIVSAVNTDLSTAKKQKLAIGNPL